MNAGTFTALNDVARALGGQHLYKSMTIAAGPEPKRSFKEVAEIISAVETTIPMEFSVFVYANGYVYVDAKVLVV